MFKIEHTWAKIDSKFTFTNASNSPFNINRLASPLSIKLNSILIDPQIASRLQGRTRDAILPNDRVDETGKKLTKEDLTSYGKGAA